MTTPPGLSDDPVELLILTEIAIIAHLADNELARLLPKGVSTAQFGVLNRLVRTETAETISEMAAAFQVSQPTMSSTIARLRKAGLIRQTPDPTDRRAKHIHITQAGRDMRADCVGRIAELRSDFDLGVGADTLAAILPSLTRIREALDRRRLAKD